MKNKLNKIITIVCFLMICTTMTAFAATTLLTYNGTGIGGKFSVNSFNISSNSNITINHNTTAWSGVGPASTLTLTIRIYQKNSLGLYSSTKDYFTCTGVGSNKATFNINSGTYKLYFSSNMSAAAADINGTVVK